MTTDVANADADADADDDDDDDDDDDEGDIGVKKKNFFFYTILLGWLGNWSNIEMLIVVGVFLAFFSAVFFLLLFFLTIILEWKNNIAIIVTVITYTAFSRFRNFQDTE